MAKHRGLGQGAFRVPDASNVAVNRPVFDRLRELARGAFCPVVADQRRVKLRLVQVLQDTPGSHRVVLVDTTDRLRTLWLDKRHTQVGGNHVYLDHHVAVREGLA